MSNILKKNIFYICICIMGTILKVNAEIPYDLIITNNQDVENRMIFLDNLENCIPHKYHAEPAGIYEIFGKKNNACSVKWILVQCEFPQGVYQEFTNVQRRRVNARIERIGQGFTTELKDKDYRYLLYTGNKYCYFNY